MDQVRARVDTPATRARTAGLGARLAGLDTPENRRRVQALLSRRR